MSARRPPSRSATTDIAERLVLDVSGSTLESILAAIAAEANAARVLQTRLEDVTRAELTAERRAERRHRADALKQIKRLRQFRLACSAGSRVLQTLWRERNAPQ